MDELNLTEMSLLCEELCKFVVEIRKTDKTQLVSTAEHPANSVLTAAIHTTGEATNAS